MDPIVSELSSLSLTSPVLDLSTLSTSTSTLTESSSSSSSAASSKNCTPKYHRTISGDLVLIYLNDCKLMLESKTLMLYYQILTLFLDAQVNISLTALCFNIIAMGGMMRKNMLACKTSNYDLLFMSSLERIHPLLVNNSNFQSSDIDALNATMTMILKKLISMGYVAACS